MEVGTNSVHIFPCNWLHVVNCTILILTTQIQTAIIQFAAQLINHAITTSTANQILEFSEVMKQYCKFLTIEPKPKDVEGALSRYLATSQVSLHELNFKTNDLVFFFFYLRLFQCTETVSCRLSLRMAWMEMD